MAIAMWLTDERRQPLFFVVQVKRALHEGAKAMDQGY
jgi:hypothetical protein